MNNPFGDYVDGMPKWLFPPWQPNQEGTWYVFEILHIAR